MQAMTIVSIQDENLDGFKLGDLTPLKIQSSHYNSSGTHTYIYIHTLSICGENVIKAFCSGYTCLFSVSNHVRTEPQTASLWHQLYVSEGAF